MIRSYFDIKDVLLGEQQVSMTFNTPCFAIGKEITARTAEGERVSDVDRGSRAVMPMWTAEPLRRSGFATLTTIPQEYHNVVFREFKIDPLAPNLRAKSPVYYEHGFAIASMLPPNERLRLRNQLNRLFQVRFYPILNATSKKGHDFQELRETLVEAEQMLLMAVLEHEVTERTWGRASTAS